MLVSLRTPPTYKMQEEVQIDRGGLKMRNLVAMQANVEALGHGMVSDYKTLELMVELAKKSKRPIRGRFGHPGLSENATGKQIMTCTNFRIKEDNRGHFLIHDADFLPAARISPSFSQDPIDYIFTMAETAPSEWAESVVIKVKAVWTRADGSEIPLYEKFQDEEGETRWRKNPRPSDALTKLPVMRPEQFWYCDMVNEGALTHDGLFGPEQLDLSEIFDGHSSEHLHQIFQVVDSWRDAYRIPLSDLQPKIDQVLSAYISTRKDIPTMNHNNAQYEPADGQDLNSSQPQQQQQRPPTRRPKQDPSIVAANALLDQAEQLAQTASAQTAVMDQLGGQVVTRTELTAQGESLQDLQIQVSELRTAVNTLTERYNALSARQQEFQDLTIKMQTAAQTAINHMQMQLATFQQNLQRMDGQPVVDRPIRLHGDINALQPLSFAAPVPGNWVNNQQPQHYTQRRQELPYDDNSPEAQAIRAQQRRQHYSV